MNLFLETPQQAAERMLREQQWHEHALRNPGMPRGLDLDEPWGYEQASYDYGRMDKPRQQVGGPYSGYTCDYSDAGAQVGAVFGGRVPRSRDVGENGGVPADAASYSLEQEVYRNELAYDKKRRRQKKLSAVFRVIACAIGIPVGLVVAFLAAYTLTCMMSGATVEEVMELLKNLLENAYGLLRDALMSR